MSVSRVSEYTHFRNDIVRLWKAGETRKDISRILGIPFGAVRYVLDSESLLRRKPKQQEEIVDDEPPHKTKSLGVRCKYPGCGIDAVARFALVPLCEGHHTTIRTETALYYVGKGETEDKRPHYNKIKHLTPWRR